MVGEVLERKENLRVRCGICGNDDAIFVCHVCQMPTCDTHTRTVLSVLGKELPFSVQYCKDCHKKWLRRILRHYRFNPLPKLR